MLFYVIIANKILLSASQYHFTRQLLLNYIYRPYVTLIGF